MAADGDGPRANGGRNRSGRGRRAARGRAAPRLVLAALLVLLLPLALAPRVTAQEEAPPSATGEPAAPEAPDPMLEVPGEDGIGAEPEDGDAVDPPPLTGARGPVPGEEWAPPRTVYVPETGQTVDGVFLDVWREWGGAAAFGHPLTPEFEENGRIVQYYGYARFEYWPEATDGEVVRFGDVGAELRPHLVRRGPGDAAGAATEAAMAARAWLPLDPAGVGPDDGEWRFVAETGHGVAGAIKAYWEAIGGVENIGNPLCEQYALGNVTYQVFERGTIALPEGGTASLMPVGEVLVARYGLETAPVPQGDVPTYAEELFVPPPAPVEVAKEEAAAAAKTADPNGERWIEVSLERQYLTAWQGDVAVWEGSISTGREGFDTPPGSYRVLSKLESQTMEGVLGGEYYNVPDVPDVMYFTDLGHAIHGTYWHANFGTPMSHGCVNLPMDAADWMYGWAPIGARVEVVP